MDKATRLGPLDFGGRRFDREGSRALWLAAAAVLPGLSFLLSRYVGLGYQVGPWAYWPINGILCGIFFRRAYRDWPAIALLAIVSQVATIYAVRGSLLPGGATVIGAVVLALQTMLAAFAARNLCDAGGPLTRARDVAWFVLIVVCLIPLGTTLLSAAVYGPALTIGFSAAWIPLFAGNSLSILLFAPPVMYVPRDGDKTELWRAGPAERVIGQLLIGTVAILIFVAPDRLLKFVVLPYALIPMLAWSAIRCGFRWTMSAVIIIATIGAWTTARGIGPFAHIDSVFGDRVLQLQTYLALLAITGILLSTLWEQARHAFEDIAILAEIREGFFDASIAGLVLRDLTGRTVLANSAYARISGHSKDEIIGKSPADLLPAATADLIRSRDRLVLERGEAMTFDENVLVDGRMRNFVVTRFPVRDSGGEPRYIGAVAREVTEERALMERLYRAQRVELVGHLAAGIAHDLNNLLTTINVSAELVRASGSLTGENQELLSGLEEAGSTASRLTARLLSLGRARPPQSVAIDVDDAIRGIGPMLRVLVRGVVDLDMKLGAPGARVFADPLTVEQVVLNLVSNARDAIPEAGTVSITTEIISPSQLRNESEKAQADRWIRLQVSDTGIGMDNQGLAQLFEPFFSTKGDKGTGLGLYTTSIMVRQAGGDIFAASEPGKGTTFTVDLPSKE